MKFGIAVLVAALLLAWPCGAQEDYRVELFGGYVNQKGDGTEARKGWIASETVYIRPWIGIIAEFAGLYRERQSTFFLPLREIRADLDDNQSSYLFGPRFRLLSKKRFTLGAHGLFGVARRESDSFFLVTPPAELDLPPSASVITRTKTRFSGAVGLSLDLKLSKRVSWRVQPDWHFVDDRDERIDSFRVSTGIVFRFGR